MKKLFFASAFILGFVAQVALACMPWPCGSIQLTEKCPEDKPFMNCLGECVGCDDTRGFLVDNEELCLRCPNRMIMKREYGYDTPSSSHCVLKECPKEAPVRSALMWGCGTDEFYGSCFSCDEPQPIVSNEEVRSKCPERYFMNSFSYVGCPKNQFRVEDLLDNVRYITNPEQVNVYTNDSTPFFPIHSDRVLYEVYFNWDKVPCEDCTISKDAETTKEECDKCPNRIYFAHRCILKKECPKEAPVLGEDYLCYSCNQQSVILTSQEECQKCENSYMVNDYCIINKQEGYFLGAFGNRMFSYWSRDNFTTGLFSCEFKEDVVSIPEECARCPNREYVDYKCILK